jgi:hypothetical protein
VRPIHSGLAEEAPPVLPPPLSAWGTGERSPQWPRLGRRCLPPRPRTAAAGGGSWAMQGTPLLAGRWQAVDWSSAHTSGDGDREQERRSHCAADDALLLGVRGGSVGAVDELYL